jgi:hypothetical protein
LCSKWTTVSQGTANVELLDHQHEVCACFDCIVNNSLLSDVKVDNFGKLGEGTFAECYKGTLWGKEVAVKMFKLDEVTDDLLTEFYQEVNTLR